MEYIIATDMNQSSPTSPPQFMIGPDSEIKSCYAIITRVEPWRTGPPLHIHPGDQFYYCIDGRLNLQIGDQAFPISTDTLVQLPAGTPHCNYNNYDDYQWHLEIVAPAPPTFEQLVAPGEYKHVNNAEKLVRRWDKTPKVAAGEGTDRRWMTNRAQFGSEVAISVDELQKGAGEKQAKTFKTDHLFFTLKGDLTVDLDGQRHEVPPMSLVIAPAEMAHAAYNTSNAPAKYLSIWINDPN